MKFIFSGLVAVLLAFLAPLTAQSADQQLTPQQQRMKSCNAQASGKQMKGNERRTFMSECLRGEANGKELTVQQKKMAECNRTASERSLKGDDRRSFMKECLSAKAGSSAAGR